MSLRSGSFFFTPTTFSNPASWRWGFDTPTLSLFTSAAPKEGSYQLMFTERDERLGWPTCVLAPGISTHDLTIIRVMEAKYETWLSEAFRVYRYVRMWHKCQWVSRGRKSSKCGLSVSATGNVDATVCLPGNCTHKREQQAEISTFVHTNDP